MAVAAAQASVSQSNLDVVGPAAQVATGGCWLLAGDGVTRIETVASDGSEGWREAADGRRKSGRRRMGR